VKRLQEQILKPQAVEYILERFGEIGETRTSAQIRTGQPPLRRPTHQATRYAGVSDLCRMRRIHNAAMLIVPMNLDQFLACE
jgi:hypothetical protein